MTATDPTSEHTGIVRFTRPAPPALGFTGALERVTGLGLGATGIALRASVDAIERFVPTDSTTPDDNRIAGPMGDVIHVLPGAVLGIAFAMRRGLLAASATVERGATRAVDVIGRPRLVQAPITAAERYLDDWNQRALLEQEHNQALVTEFARRLAPALAEAIVTRLDIGEIVAQLPVDAIIEQVDVNALIQRVDLDAVLAKVDVDAIIGRVDVDALVARADVEKIIERVDVDQLMDRVDVERIIDRVDVEKIIERVDIDAILGRVDLGPIVADVLDEVDISGIVRDSTGTVTGDILDTGRVTAMRLDLFTERLTDRILLRRRARRLAIEGYDPEATEREPEMPVWAEPEVRSDD